jgi:hypothetical protein
MTASELIKEFRKNIKKYGDFAVKIHNTYGESLSDDFENINIVHIDFDDGEGIEVMEATEEHFVLEGF